MVRARYRGALSFRILSAFVSLVFLLSLTGVGYAVPAVTTPQTEETQTVAPPDESVAPEAPVPAADPALVPVAGAPVVDAAASTDAALTATPVVPFAKRTPSGKKAAAPLSTSGAAPSKSWTQLATIDSASWINGDLNGNNSRYFEGMSVPQRLVLDYGSPSAGGSHSVTFSYGYTKNTKHAYDFITSWSQAVASANTIGGQTFSDSWKWIGLTASDFTDHETASIPRDTQAGSKEDVYVGQYGARSLDIWAAGSISGVTVSTPVVSGDSPDDMEFTVTWTGSASKVMILLAGHIAVSLDPELTGIGWGQGEGASAISGSPYHIKLAGSTDWNGNAGLDNQLQPAGVYVLSGITGTKFLDVNGNGVRDLPGDVGLSGWTIYDDANSNGALDTGELSTVTGSDGTYGLYTYLSSSATMRPREVAQAGFNQTCPATPQSVSVSPGAVVSGVDFGNHPENPALSIDKSTTTASYDSVGDVIHYSYTVTNSGNVTLSSPWAVLDDHIPAVDVSTAPSTLAPNGSFTVTADYHVSQADIDSGHVTNVAYATGKFGATTVTSPTDTVTVDAIRSPGLTIDKDTTTSSYSAVGNVIHYTYRVTNSGNVTLSSPWAVLDDHIWLVNVSSAPATLAPGAYFDVSADYTVDQDDIDAGSVVNVAHATGKFGATTVTSPTDTVTVNGGQNPTLHLTKSALPTTYSVVGDAITYSYRLTNTGNVTLFGPFTITDDKVTVVASTETLLAPGDFIDFTAVHVMGQGDIDAGSVTNIATGHAVFGSAPVNSNQASATVDAVQSPRLTIDKDTTTSSYSAVGNVIHYTYRVTNSGNVTLSSPWAVLDDHIWLVNVSSAPATLAPGAYFDVSADYTVDQDDIDAGSVVNVAHATGKFGATTVTSPTDTVTVLAGQHAAISLGKSAAPTTYNAADQTIVYTYTITNTGNVTLFAPFQIEDNRIGTFSEPIPGTLAPQGSFTATAAYTITQADVDAGHVTNDATASVMFGQARIFSNPASATVTAVQGPAIDIVKSGVFAPGANHLADVGELVTYTFSVSNAGNVTLSNISVTDPKVSTITYVSGDANGNGTLELAETWTYTGSYPVTQADIDAGSVDNTATAHGVSPLAVPVSDHDTETVDLPKGPALSLSKSALPTTYTAAGQIITYTYTITNNGNVTLFQPFQIEDSKIGTFSKLLPSTLAPTVSFTATAAYEITQADLDAGHVTNDATASVGFGEGRIYSNPAQATVTAVQDKALTLTKSAAPVTYDHVGQVITYTYKVHNAGNVTLSTVSVTDDKVTGAISGPATLAPDTTTTVTASYVITQADLNSGSVTNHAIAHALFGETPVDSNQAQATVTAVQNKALTLTKSAAPVTYDHIGQVITYTYKVHNAGNVTLSTVSVTDDKVTGAISGPATLAPDTTTTVTASYVITQADLNSGSVTNHAIAHALFGETPVDSNQAQATVTAITNPSLLLAKSPSPVTYNAVGQTITYTYTLTNNGNVTLIAPFTVTDDKVAVAPSVATVLLPGASTQFTATHAITQGDLDAGSITNHAIGHGMFGQVQVDSNQAQATVTAVQNPRLTLAKSATPLIYNAVGDVIAYSYVLTNSGNVTLTGPFTITDDKVTVTVPSTASLAPGAHIDATANHTMAQADLDAGSVTNLATGHGFFGQVVVNSNQATATVTAGQSPRLSLTKTPSPATYSAVGDTITYTYVLTNAGNVTLTGPFTITDDKVAVTASAVSLLAPGASVTFTASHVMTQADLDAGSVTNLATGHGFFGQVVVNSNQATATVTAVQRPALTLAKTALPLIYNAAGDTITYTYVLTNAGNVTLAGPFTITDDKVTVTVPSTASLAPGASITGTAVHVMTQADVDAGSVTNLAIGHGFFGQVVVNSNQATATVTAGQSPRLSLIKTPSAATYAAVGDTITYTYVLTNIGNVTLTGPFAITDDKVIVLPSAVSLLAPGASVTFTASHVMTQADIDAGSVTNLATGRGFFGVVPVDSNQATATVTAVQSPVLTLAKSADPVVYGVVGDTITYTYVLTNAGNVTLTGPFTVTDDKVAVAASAVAALAPGASVTFTAVYAATQADIDAGSITNHAIGHGFLGTTAVDSNQAQATVDAFLPFTPPDLTITKAASVPTAGPADVVTYTLQYRNLSGDSPTDFTITDTYDSRYMSVVNASGGDTSVAGKIVWTIAGPLAVEDGWQTLTYTMRVKSSIPSGTTHVKNTVVILTPDDSDTTNDTASAVIDISEELPFLPFTGGPFSPLPLYALLTAAAGMALLLGLRRRRTA